MISDQKQNYIPIIFYFRFYFCASNSIYDEIYKNINIYVESNSFVIAFEFKSVPCRILKNTVRIL